MINLLFKKCTAKSVAGRCNTSVQLSDEKVVHAYDIEDLGDKEVYWDVVRSMQISLNFTRKW